MALEVESAFSLSYLLKENKQTSNNLFSLIQVPYTKMTHAKGKKTHLLRCILGSPFETLTKSSIRRSLKNLREVCNLPYCNFKKIPKNISYKYQNPFLKLYEINNNFINCKVGATGNTNSTYDWRNLSTIGSGWSVTSYHNDSVSRLHVSMVNNIPNSNTKKLSWWVTRVRSKNPWKRPYKVIYQRDFRDDGIKPYVSEFILYAPKNRADLEMQSILLSSVECFQDIKYALNYWTNLKFKEICNSALKRFTQTNIIITPVKPRVVSVNKAREVSSSVEVKLQRYEREGEVFVVSKAGKEDTRVLNDDNAIRNLFNATLNGGKYKLHPEAKSATGKRFKYYKDGFCWLDVFADANRRIPEWVKPHCLLRGSVLMSCGLWDFAKRKMVSVSHGLLHYDRKLERSSARAGVRDFVGASNEAVQREDFRDLDLRVEEFAERVLETANLRSDNRLIDNILTRASDYINKKSKESKELDINVCLSMDEKKMITNLFPDIQMSFNQKSYSNHGVFNAMRACENFYFSRKFKNSDYIDAGGDVVSTLRSKNHNVHICSPRLDLKDAARHIQRATVIDGLKGYGETISFCTNKTENCTVNRDIIIAVEVYDMTLRDMAKAMLSHGSRKFEFSCIIPPEIFTKECNVELYEGRLKVTRIGDNVEYYYGSNGETFSHSCQTLKDILSVQVFQFGGRVFKKTLEHSRGQLHFFSICICEKIEPGSVKLKTYYQRSELDKVTLRIPVKDSFGVVTHYIIKEDREFVSSMIEYVANTGIKIDDKMVEWTYSQYRAKKTVTIKSGKVTQKETRIRKELIPGFIAIIMSEGIRAREKTHYLAKMLYTSHYKPSIVNIIFRLIMHFLGGTKRFIYESLVDCLKFLTNSDYIDTIVNTESRIEDLDKWFVFEQNVTITTDAEDQPSILEQSMKTFLSKYSEDVYERGDRSEFELEEFSSEQDLVDQLLNSGGGSKEDEWFYSYIFSIVRTKCTLSLAWRWTNRIFNFITSCRAKGREFVKYIYEIIKIIINKPWEALCHYLVQGYKTVLKIPMTCVDSVNYLKRKSLEKILSYFSHERADDEYIFPGYDSDFSEESGDYGDENTELDSRSRCTVIKSKVEMLFRNIKGHIEKFLQRCGIIDQYNKIYHWFKSILTDVDCFNSVLNFITHTGCDALLAVLTGHFSIASCALKFMTDVVIEKNLSEKHHTTTKLIAGNLTQCIYKLDFIHPIWIPIRWGVKEISKIHIKKKLLNWRSTKEVTNESICKDLVHKSYIKYFDIKKAVWLLWFSLLIIFLHPTLGFFILFSIYPAIEIKRYYNNVVCFNNIKMSYPHVIDRLGGTYNFAKLKKAVREKFSENKSQGVKISEIPAEKDEDVMPPLEEVETPKRSVGRPSSKQDDIEDECNIKEDPTESLNFSNIEATSNRYDTLRVGNSKLCKFLRFYPKSKCYANIQTGDLIRDSIEEFYHLERSKLDIEISKMQRVVEIMNDTGRMLDNVRRMIDDRSMYVTLDGVSWYRLGCKDKNPAKEDFKAIFDHNFNIMEGDAKVKEFAVSSDEWRGMYSNERCRAIEQLFNDNNEMVRRPDVNGLKFYNKPPGAGKTTTIAKLMSKDLKNKVKCLALSYTKVGRLELIDKLKKDGIEKPEKYVKTYDSFLMNNDNILEIVNLYCDEVFMMHAGHFLTLLTKIAYQNGYCYGDVNQIPFINRDPYTPAYLSSEFFRKQDLNYDTYTYRCPLDTCYLLSNLKDEMGNIIYAGGVKNVNEVYPTIRSLNLFGINGVGEVPVEYNAKYLTFTQDEKLNLQRHIDSQGGCRNAVSTVNEAQGCTFSEVNLVRLVQFDNPVMSDINQFVVAISRHTTTFKYFTPHSRLNDRVSNAISSLQSVSDFVLKDYHFRQCL